MGNLICKKRHIGANLAESLGKEVHTFDHEGRNTSRDAAPVRGPRGSRGCGIRKAGYVRHGRSERLCDTGRRRHKKNGQVKDAAAGTRPMRAQRTSVSASNLPKCRLDSQVSTSSPNPSLSGELRSKMSTMPLNGWGNEK